MITRWPLCVTPPRRRSRSAAAVLAEELGIEVTKDSRIGWSPTAVPAATHEAYPEVIATLRAALRLHRARETIDAGQKPKRAQPRCVCDCGRRIRVARSVLEVAPIVCGICSSEFLIQSEGEA
ncbi:MAG: hypothetical protein ACRDRK_12140 [Pseudonocardia sp.]